jgi:hypothetical protein
MSSFSWQFPNSHMSNLAASPGIPNYLHNSKRESRPELKHPIKQTFCKKPSIKIAWCMVLPADAISYTWLHELQRDNCKHCKFQMFTYTTGIFRRISEQRYKHTEMAIPAMKFWYRRLLSLLGIKAALKTPVISNTRYDSCIY